MKILYPNNIASVTASTYDPEYPAANLLNNTPQKVWKATAHTALLTIITSGVASGLFICNTNADSYVVEVKNVAGTLSFEDTSDDFYETHVDDFAGGRVFIQFEQSYTTPVRVEVTLVSATANIYAGIARCGAVITIPDPAYGMKSERQDFSVRAEYSNGGMYSYKRQTPRSYGISILTTHTQFESLDGLYNSIGSAPVPVLILVSINRADYWSGFFHVTEPPSGSYAYPNLIDCTFTLREAV